MSESARRPLVDGRFELVSRLGSGGMGTVWRARDIALDREVALKEVRPPDPAHEEAAPGLTAQLRERAVREARALARLSNPHVVTIHHIVEPQDGSHPWIVMELVEGCSVQDRLAQGPMPVSEVLRLGRGVLSALRAAHAVGIHHRDVKPANVLLRPDGDAVLTDFGIAALHDQTTRLTATGDLIGSPEFIAPERIRGQEGNPASDLWSLGMLLYVAAEGHHPLRRATNLATLVAVLDEPIPEPVRSGALAPVLTRLLVRDPALRPDGSELRGLLKAAEEAPEAQPAPAAPPAPVPGPQVWPLPGGSAATVPDSAAVPSPAPVPEPQVRPLPGGSAATVPDSSPAPPNGTFGPPVPPTTRRRRGLPILLALAAVLTAGTFALVRWLPDGGTGGADRATESPGLGAPAGGGQDTPASGPPATPSETSPGPGQSPQAAAPEKPRGSLLTTANVWTVIDAFREVSGTTRFKELTVYEEYALASIPTEPGARTYDRFEFRDGTARRTGVGGTIRRDDADEQPFDAAALDWDALPDLMKRGERELDVENPSTRYLIVGRWTFNSDQPTLRFYLSNEYHATGYLAADGKGKVVATYPAT
ncbi:protein kinase [Streptomyces sp. MUM 203J]|nr:protein kinase [Streptomyces sp. MUM 203J]